MSHEGYPAEGQPIETDVTAVIRPYIDQFAHKLVGLTRQDNRYPVWSAFTLAVFMYTDETGEKDGDSFNRLYSDALDSARIDQGLEPKGMSNFSDEQRHLFRRLVFGGLDTASSKLSVTGKPEELLEGIRVGLYGHRSITDMAHK